MKLSPRLKTITELVEKGERVADVGTDHAYIPSYLYSKGISDKVIASDINQGPLENARQYLEKEAIIDAVDLRLGGGLEPIEVDEVDTAIIAGMGGNMIIEILEASSQVAKSIKKFIFQPMTGIEELKRYLYKNSYTVCRERLVKEGQKYYQIIEVKHGQDQIECDANFEISRALIEGEDPLLVEFIQFKLKKLEAIISGIDDSSSAENIEKREQLKKKRDGLEGVLASVS